MKRFLGIALGACMVVAAMGSAAQAWVYTRASSTAGGVRVLGLGAPAAATIACVATEAGADETPIVGRNSIGGYSNGTAAVFPPTCVIQLNAWEGPNCADGTLLDQAFVPVSGCTPAPPVPAAPFPVSGNPQTTTSYQAVWTDVAPLPVAYNVYTCQTTAPMDCGPAGDPIHFVGSVPPGTEELLVTGLPPATMHNVKVCADTPPNPEVCTTFMGVGTAPLVAPAPPIINNVLANPTSEQKISWTDTNGDAYDVEYCQSAPVDLCPPGPVPNIPLTTVGPGVQMATNIGLTPGASYAYHVCATAGGVRMCSASASIATEAIVAPAPPTITNVPANPTTQQKIDWADSNGDSYDVEYCQSAPVNLCLGGTTPNILLTNVGPGVQTATNIGLDPGATYFYHVCAKVGAVKMCSGTAGLMTEAITAPAAPSVDNVSLTEQLIQWVDTNADTYTVRYCKVTAPSDCNGTEPSQILASGIGAGVMSASHTGLSPATNYRYDVCGVTGAIEMCGGNTSLVTNTLTMPTAFTLVLGPKPTTQLEASWTDSNGVDYEVFYCEVGVDCGGGGDPTTSAGSVGTGTQMLLLDNLTPGTQYHAKVCALAGGTLACTAHTGNTTEAVMPPTALALSPQSTDTIAVSWTDSNGDDYDVFYCNVDAATCGGGGEPNTLADSVLPGVENYQLIGLDSDTTYNVSVCARVNPSACAAFATATTPAGGLALVAQTGISTCFDALGFVIACPPLPPTDPPAAGSGQDGAIMAGQVPPSPRYIDGDPSCDANGVGLPGVNFLDTLTDLCFLYDNCNAGGTCTPVAAADWDTLMLGSTDICDPVVDATCFAGCSGTDGSAHGDWRIANANETFSQVGFDNNLSTTVPGIPQELVDLITANAPGALGCWDRVVWTSTTAELGVPPAALLPTAGAYGSAIQMDWSTTTSISGADILAFPKSFVETGILVKDPAP